MVDGLEPDGLRAAARGQSAGPVRSGGRDRRGTGLLRHQRQVHCVTESQT